MERQHQRGQQPHPSIIEGRAAADRAPLAYTEEEPMFYRTDDLRIRSTKVVLPPVFLEEEMPVTEAASATVFHARREIVDILHQRDHRLLVVAGPCSIHDPTAARDYARRLKDVDDRARPRAPHCHARLLRKAAHHARLEGPHQRSVPRRVLPHQRWPAPRAPPASRPRRDGRARRHRIPRYDLAAVSSPSWSAGAPSARAPPKARAIASSLRASPARSASRTAPPATCRSPSRLSSPPATRTPSSATPNTDSPPFSSPPAMPIATSSCAAGAKPSITTPPR